MTTPMGLGIMSLVAGVLILLARLLNYVVAIYLIIFGILTLLGY
jgi:hypothetical protein